MRIILVLATLILTGCSANKTPVLTLEQCTKPGQTNCVPKPEISPRVNHVVYFDSGSALLTEDVGELLYPHSKYLILNPGRRVYIEGLADETGDFDKNLVLGQKRAEAVMRALIALGVDQSQLIVHSSGVTRKQSQSSLAKNRCVVLSY